MKRLMIYLSIFCIFSMAWAVFCQEAASPSAPSPEVDEGDAHNKAVLFAREGQFKEALELMKEVIGRESAAPGAIFDYIVILSWSGQCEEAIKAYEGLAQGYEIPDYAIPEIAKCYHVMGNYDKAIEFYQKYRNVKGREKDAIESIFYTYLDAGQIDNARRFIKQEAENSKIKEVDLQIYYADILMRERKADEAGTIYKKVLEMAPDNTHAQLWVSKKMILEGKYQEADVLVDKILKKEPKNIEALFCKGEILEAQAEYMKAFQLYEKILAIYPKSQIALNLKYRALVSMGSNSLVEQKLKETGDQIDPKIIDTLRGNKAMHRIWWWETDSALQILDKNKDYAELEPQKPFALRTYYDEILALEQKSDMEGVLREYANINKMTGRPLDEVNKEMPPWVLAAVGDAYLGMREPEKALPFYEEVLAQEWDPEYGQTTMSMYQAWIETGKYKEAGELLGELDSRVPVQIVDRGILKDNARKAEIVYNRDWWYIYQDRLAEAQYRILQDLSRAPSDTNIRISLAQTYLWRGWPRLALEEFQIAHSQDPEDIAGKVGYCYALDENDRGIEARAMAEELLKKNPNNKYIKQLNRYFEVRDMRKVTVSTGWTREKPGAKELNWSTRYEQVILPDRKIFADYFWRNTSDSSEENVKNMTRRASAGVDWRLNRDWWFVGAVSDVTQTDDIGGYGQVTFNPDDYFSFIWAYDSYSLAIPLRARAFDIKGEEWDFTAIYRRSESFSSQAGVSYIDMSDGNKDVTYRVLLDKAITTRAYWKTRVALEGSLTTNSAEGALYYNPERAYSIDVIPMVEHVWYERYEKSMTDRLYVDYGIQKQKDFSSDTIGSIRYEQDYKISDTLAFLVGYTYSLENYDGEHTDVDNFDFTLSYSF
ncbi:MAG: tetratricopeptide repeat protein [Candidatus Omnitrophica bacterium]|nr:tetratricopeptide repeat protein [Candidatus Omnitrophota bacterium]MBU1933366.1 tetratricopeptide repeat protein [Candidatus Omnitrophota bacterium]